MDFKDSQRLLPQDELVLKKVRHKLTYVAQSHAAADPCHQTHHVVQRYGFDLHEPAVSRFHQSF